MGTLKEDIKTQAAWIIKAFEADGFKLDGTIDSIIEVDRFFNLNMKDGQPKKGGRLYKKGYGAILFSIGSYVGETIIKNVPGTEWVTDDNDPAGEINISLVLPDGGIVWPVQKILKRFENGAEDAIYPYVHAVTKDLTGLPFNDEFWTLTAELSPREQTKPWWKCW
jgi:hypothetical protein